MNKDQVIQFLNALGAKNVQPRGKWVSCSCVLAPWTHTSGKDSHPSFAVKIEEHGESMFNCYSCEHGNLDRLLMRLKYLGAGLPKYDLKTAYSLLDAEQNGDIVLTIKDFEQEDEEDIDFPYSESWFGTFVKWRQAGYAIEYMQKRGVPAAVADFLDVRFDSARRAVCFPIRDFDGVLVGLRARYINPEPDAPPYHIYKTKDNRYNKMPWLGEHWLNFDKPVLMVESVFDLASAYRVYRNVCAPLSVGMNAGKLLRMRRATEIVTLFDWGKGGDKARVLVDKYLSDSRSIYQLSPTEEDGDPGEMSVERLQEVLSPYLTLDPVIN